MDVVTEDDGSLQVHECNVSVHVLFPVVLGMDDDFIQQSNPLFVLLISEIVMKERTCCTVATESSGVHDTLRCFVPSETTVFTLEHPFRFCLLLPSLSL